MSWGSSLGVIGFRIENGPGTCRDEKGSFGRISHSHIKVYFFVYKMKYPVIDITW
jgi:hypothetical protein